MAALAGLPNYFSRISSSVSCWASRRLDLEGPQNRRGWKFQNQPSKRKCSPCLPLFCSYFAPGTGILNEHILLTDRHFTHIVLINAHFTNWVTQLVNNWMRIMNPDTSGAWGPSTLYCISFSVQTGHIRIRTSISTCFRLHYFAVMIWIPFLLFCYNF